MQVTGVAVRSKNSFDCNSSSPGMYGGGGHLGLSPHCKQTPTQPQHDYISGRNAAHRGFHPSRNPSTGWCKFPPAVPFTPALPASTRISAEMKPLMGGESSIRECAPRVPCMAQNMREPYVFALVQGSMQVRNVARHRSIA